MAAELKKSLGVEAKLTPGSKGIFDVVRDGKIVYSKHSTGRFPDDNEVVDILTGDAPPDKARPH